MAREDVNVKVSANVAEALQLWRAMEKGPEGMAGALGAMGDKGKQSARGLAGELEGLVGKWASIGAAIAGAQALLASFFNDMKRMREETEKTTFDIEESTKRFLVQAGMRADQSSAVQQALFGIATSRKVSLDSAFTAGTQLVSSGFSSDQLLQGGALSEFLQLLAATNATGKEVNSAELAKSMVQFMTAQGAPLTAAGVRENAVAIQSLFKGTNLQTAQLSRFAPDAATISNFTGLGGPEMLALFSQFLDVTDEAKGSTAFRAGALRLGTAGANKETQRGLAMLGLTAEDVDFQGENFFEVQERLITAMEKVEGNVRNNASKLIFGAEGMPFSNVLLTREGQAAGQQRIGLTRNEAAYAEAVAFAESGRGPTRVQSQTERDVALFDPTAPDSETLRNRLETYMEEQGFSPIRRTAERMGFSMYEKLTNDPAYALEQVILDEKNRRRFLGEELYNLRHPEDTKSFNDTMNELLLEEPEHWRNSRGETGPAPLRRRVNESVGDFMKRERLHRESQQLRIQVEDVNGNRMHHDPAVVNLNGAQ